jgi:hypothetical protein
VTDDKPLTRRQLWAIARFDLGLSGREFGRLSYRTMDALLARYNLRRETEDFRAGQICAIVANCLAPRKGRPHGPHNFFGSLKQIEQTQSPLEMLAQIELINATQNAKR